MDRIVNSLEGECSVGNTELWVAIREGGWQGGGLRRQAWKRVSAFSEFLFYLLESWSISLDLESVSQFGFGLFFQYSGFYLAVSEASLASKHPRVLIWSSV